VKARLRDDWRLFRLDTPYTSTWRRWFGGLLSEHDDYEMHSMAIHVLRFDLDVYTVLWANRS
jgi:hypothetical protein